MSNRWVNMLAVAAIALSAATFSSDAFAKSRLTHGQGRSKMTHGHSHSKMVHSQKSGGNVAHKTSSNSTPQGPTVFSGK